MRDARGTRNEGPARGETASGNEARGGFERRGRADEGRHGATHLKRRGGRESAGGRGARRQQGGACFPAEAADQTRRHLGGGARWCGRRVGMIRHSGAFFCLDALVKRDETVCCVRGFAKARNARSERQIG